MTTCKYCNREQVSRTAYEDGIYQILIEWLCEVTCIKWYRAPLDFERPAGHPKDDPQYGLIFIKEHLVGAVNYSTELIDCNEGAVTCFVVKNEKRITFDLTVFREIGAKENCDDQDDDESQMPYGSAVDVLAKISDLTNIEEFSIARSTSGVNINPTNRISSDVRKIHEVYERFSYAEFTADICYSTSYQVDQADLVYCVELCDGTPACVPKEYPDCGN